MTKIHARQIQLTKIHIRKTKKVLLFIKLLCEQRPIGPQIILVM